MSNFSKFIIHRNTRVEEGGCGGLCKGTQTPHVSMRWPMGDVASAIFPLCLPRFGKIRDKLAINNTFKKFTGNWCYRQQPECDALPTIPRSLPRKILDWPSRLLNMSCMIWLRTWTSDTGSAQDGLLVLFFFKKFGQLVKNWVLHILNDFVLGMSDIPRQNVEVISSLVKNRYCKKISTINSSGTYVYTH
jgi:hypothetical protein